MWREGEGKASHPNISVFQGDRRVSPTNHGTWAAQMMGKYPVRIGRKPMKPLALWRLPSWSAASAGRRDGRLSEKLGKIDHGGQAVALTFEQHLPLQRGRAEQRITLKNLLAQFRIVDGHQAKRLRKRRVRTRQAQGLVQEHPAIKCLVFLADGRGADIDAEMFACNVSEPQRDVWKLRILGSANGIGDEAVGVDDNLALGQFGLEQVRKGIDGRRVAMLGRRDADTNRTGQLAAEVNAENPGIRQIVEAIGQALIGPGVDGSFVDIGPIS